MRVEEIIDISCIKKLDRYPLVPQTLDLSMKLLSGEVTINSLPPIHTVLENGSHRILDGRHRYTAIKLAGINKIKTRYGRKKTSTY